MTIKLSSVFDYSLKAFLFIGTVFYLPFHIGQEGDPIKFGYESQELFFRYGVIVIFALSCMIKRHKQLEFQSIPFFLLWAVLIALIYGFDGIMRNGILNVFLAVLFYKIVYEYVEPRELKSFAWWLGWLLFLNLIWCVLQWFGHDPLFTHVDAARVGKMDSIIGLMRLKVHLGVLAALVMPVVSFYAPAFLLCCIPLLIFGKASTAALAVVVSFLIIGWNKLHKITFFIVSILVLIAGGWFIFFYDMPGGQFGERFKVWGAVLGMSMKQFIFTGAGVSKFATLHIATMQKNGQPLEWMWVHNEFIQGLYEFGIIGMSAVIAYLIGIHNKAVKHLKDNQTLVLYASVFSIAIISFCHFPFHLGRFVPIMIFLMATLHSRVDHLEDRLSA